MMRLTQQPVAFGRSGQLLQLRGQRAELVDSLAVVLALVRHRHLIPVTGIRKRDNEHEER